jgi:hypothetical protein
MVSGDADAKQTFLFSFARAHRVTRLNNSGFSPTSEQRIESVCRQRRPNVPRTIKLARLPPSGRSDLHIGEKPMARRAQWSRSSPPSDATRSFFSNDRLRLPFLPMEFQGFA